MAIISPKKAQNEAIDIINRVITEKRNISEFENARIISHLDSLHRARSESYDEISACYYSQIADVDNLLKSVDSVFSSHSNDGMLNVIYALNNAMRYKEIYKYIKKHKLYFDSRSFIETAVKAGAFCGDHELSKEYMDIYISNFDDDHAVEFSSHVGEVNDFFLENKKNKEALSSYLIECFDVFSRFSLIKTKEVDGAYGYSHHVFNDEGYNFLAFSFILHQDESDFDKIIEIEDDFLNRIACIECESIIKTKIAFNFEVGYPHD